MENNFNAENIYKKTAGFYAEFRPHYSKDFLAKLLKKCNAGLESKVMDLGSATGIVALDIAPLVKEVIAVDLEKEFLTMGALLAKEQGLHNIKWVKNQAENLLNIHQEVDLTIISSAFHWMERKKVLDDLYEMTNSGGAVAVITHQGVLGWQTAEVKELIKKYTSCENVHNWDQMLKEGTHEELLSASKFENFTKLEVKYERQVDIDKIIGYLYSTETCSHLCLGENKDEFETKLRKLLAKLPADAFVEKGVQEALIAYKIA